MKDINFEYDLELWLKLTDNERINIINHNWDPFGKFVYQLYGLGEEEIGIVQGRV